MSIIKSIKSFTRKYRKHDFDLLNPEPITLNISKATSNRRSINCIWNKYTCTKCGETLSLELWQMKDLPPAMSHGCNGFFDAASTERF